MEITLKDYFGHEAHDFTPWIAKHPEIIQDILEDATIKLYKREFSVQSFYIDLLFQKGNEPIIVENQYGESNHDHLGKIITYSSLINSKTCVWISESFKPEHKKIFNQLNLDLYLCTFIVEKRKINNLEKTTIKIIVNSKKGVRVLLYRLDGELLTPLRT